MSGKGDNGMPKGWTRAALDDLGSWSGGGTPSKAKPSYWTGGRIPWISPKDVKSWHLSDSEDKITREAVENSTAKRIPAGSLLLVVRSGILRRMLPVGLTTVDATVNQDLKALTPLKGLDPEYLLLAAQAFSEDMRTSCMKDGTTVQSIEFPALLRYRIPIAPLNEQRRLVVKIEELFSDLDAGVGALEKVKAELVRYRQSVLKAAFEGRLTREWREAQLADPNSPLRKEPAAKLLQRIRCEREKAEKKSGRRARRKPLPPLDTSDLPELPEGWVWVRIGDLCWRITKGSTPTSYGYEYKEHGIRFIRTEDIRVDGSIRDATFFIDEATNEFLARSVLEERDILFSIAGTIGRTGIVQTKCLPANTNQALAIIRGVWSRLYSRFLFHALRCPFVQGQTDALTVGVGRANLSLANVGGLIAPLAPLEEQAKLVSEAERHFSIADAVEKAVEQGLAQAGRLRQSILKRAFEGKLLPQDPSDEPAEKLLERIRAEKQKPARKANGGRMKRP